jgi:hypothetical protein
VNEITKPGIYTVTFKAENKFDKKAVLSHEPGNENTKINGEYLNSDY